MNKHKHFNLTLASTTAMTPFVKFNAKEGTVWRSVFDDEGRHMEEVDEFDALIVFGLAKGGWFNFGGDVPDMHLVPVTEPLPDCPGEGYKQGIQVVVYLAKHGLHLLSTTARGVIEALGQLEAEVAAAPETAKGLLPRVKIKRWVKEKMKMGTRFIPEFIIVGWRERPEALKNLGEPKPPDPSLGSGEMATPPSTGSTELPQPGAPAAVSVEDDDDFG